MAIKYWGGGKISGLSSDTKPTASTGWHFYETDTKFLFFYTGSAWENVSKGDITITTTARDGASGAHATARTMTQFDSSSLVGSIYNGNGSRSYTIATVDDVYDSGSVGNPTCIAVAGSYLFDVIAYGSNNATMDPSFQVLVGGSVVVQDVYTLPTAGTEYAGALVHFEEDIGNNVTITLSLRAADTNGSYTSGGGANNDYEGYFHGVVDGQEVLLNVV